MIATSSFFLHSNEIQFHLLRFFLSLLHCVAGLNNGELSQGFLLQQLNNPTVSQRDREMLFTVLGHFNATQSSAPENNKPHPVLPNNVRNSSENVNVTCFLRIFLFM